MDRTTHSLDDVLDVVNDGGEGLLNPFMRLLQEEDDSNNSTDNAEPLTDTETIRNAIIIYGGIFLALFLIFLIVRKFCPNAYTPKSTFTSLRTPVAKDRFGMLSWAWKVLGISHDDIADQCGMDAACTLRILEMGVKLSVVGVINSAFLVPVFVVLGENYGAEDPVKGASLSNLPQGSYAAIATTAAAYVFFGCFMHLVDKDFEWFTSRRHAFLSKRTVQNYSLFLSGLPKEMRSNRAVGDYFRRCFGEECVADVNVALVIPNLEKKVAKRNALIPKLEHATNVAEVKGYPPTHRLKGTGPCKGEKVESVPTYTNEIKDYTNEIRADIDRIESMRKERETGVMRDDVEGGEAAQLEMNHSLLYDEEQVQALPNDGSDSADEQDKPKGSGGIAGGASKLKQSILRSSEDGAPRSAAFVSFATLTSANLARQTVHNEEPWCCVPQEPPRPDFVNWKNVGRSNARKQIGELISLVLTVALCIFWTIPVAFVASLSNVEALTELLPFLKAPVENYAWFGSLLALMAPFILVVFIALLPPIILAIVKLEGNIEIETMQHPSLFAKLAGFTIVQTFFISTISSTLLSSIQDIIDNPTSMVALFAVALPAQSAYFINIIIVQNLLGLGIELLRISPVFMNFARKIVSNRMGHNLTEEERNKTFMGLRSLDDPLEYMFGKELGVKTILIKMTLFVYGCMAPITSYFTLLIFGLLCIGFRHQFIFVYPIANDSGGKLWLNFQRLSIFCAIVAEIVLCGVVFLKESFIAGALMVPLIVVTVLFNVYFKRRHYAVTAYLPLGQCAAADSKDDSQSSATHEWLKGAYLQPALKYPDDGEPESVEDPRLADKYKEKGNAYMVSKEYKLALQCYSYAIEASPSGPNSHIYYSSRAAAHCYLGDYNSAVNDCRKSIELDPTYEKAHTRLGLSLYFRGDYDSAIKAYEQSLDIDPNNQACFNYMVKAKEKHAEQTYDQIESVEVEAPFDGVCCGPIGNTPSFDPSITNDD